MEGRGTEAPKIGRDEHLWTSGGKVHGFTESRGGASTVGSRRMAGWRAADDARWPERVAAGCARGRMEMEDEP
jgi:hypothetical protein